MNYFRCLLTGLLCFAGVCTHQNRSTFPEPQGTSIELDKQIDVLVEQISSSLTIQKSNKIAVVEFQNLEGNKSDLGKYLAEELTTRLFRTGKFQIIERQLINKIIEEQKLSATGLIDESTASKLGQLLGVDAITTGTIADLNTSVKINARLIATGTGSVFSVASINVPMSKELRILSGKKPDAAPASDVSRFDGSWEVIIDCSSQEGALGYTYQTISTVKDGIFHGQYGTDGIAPCLSLDGKINPDGSAIIMATGLSGDPKYNTRNYQKGHPYSYHIDASFSDFKGTGHRIENRVCNITFIRK